MKTRPFEKLTLSTADADMAQRLYQAFSNDGFVKVGDKVYKVGSIGSSHGGVLGPTKTVDAVLVPWAEEVYATEPTVTVLDLSNPPADATHYLRVDIDHPFRKKVNGVCFSWRGQVLGWKQIEPIAEKWWEPLPTGPTIADLIGQGYLMNYKWPRSVYDGRGLLFHPCTPKAEEPAQWNGEGLPPVGVDCEVLWSSMRHEYVTCRVVGHDEGSAVYRLTSGERKGGYESGRDEAYPIQGDPDGALPVFRPIKTAEQLAAEQREAEINRFAEDITAGRSPLGSFEHSRVVATWLYDNDYRKGAK